MNADQIIANLQRWSETEEKIKNRYKKIIALLLLALSFSVAANLASLIE